jgi:hypothetical protein
MLKTTVAIIFLATSFFFAPAAEAATINAPNCSTTAVQSAINTAANGDTVSVPAGNCTWNSRISFSNAKGVSLVCQTKGSCIISASGTVLGLDGTVSGTNNNLYRISGFTFNGNSQMLMWFWGKGIMTQLRVDNNTFNLGTGSIAVFLGEDSTPANFYGVVDHNTLNSPGNSMLLHHIGAVNPNPPPSPLGTGNNIFVEDNTINITTTTDPSFGCMDTWGGSHIVWRKNTTTNCLVTSHGAIHGGGPQNFELYDNTLKVNSGSSGGGVADGYRLFHHQGSGIFVAFNNRFTAFSGKNSSAISMYDYRASASAMPACDGTQPIDGNRKPDTTYRGYPCWHQAGRDFAGNLMPMYVWNNAWSDTGGKIDMDVESGGYTPNHILANRDYYNAVSASVQTSTSAPFNGTSGMGFGTLANRPATCTTGPESLDSGKGGVGYFAIDTNTLYRCSATNTWIAHYKPYVYPHPLVSGTPAPTGATGGNPTTTILPPVLKAPVVQ